MGIDTVFREYNRVCPQESSVLGAFPVCGGMSAFNGSGPCMFGKSTSPVHETLSNRSTWGCLLKCKEFSRTLNDVLYVSLTYKLTAYARWTTAGLAQQRGFSDVSIKHNFGPKKHKLDPEENHRSVSCLSLWNLYS